MKYCSKCRQNYEDKYKFCYECGTKLEDNIGESFIDKINPNTYGIWDVYTEGDESGCGKKHLGIYEGHVDDIAFSLHKSKYYSLMFERVVPKKINGKIDVDCKSICVKMDWTWCMKSNDIAQTARDLFKDRNVEIQVGGVRDSFLIVKRGD